MNPEILRWWNLQDSISQEQWEDAYQDQLFEAKKQLRQAFYSPKLFQSKLATYQKWAQTMRSDLKWLVSDSYRFENFSEFESWASVAQLSISRSEDFESLVIVGHQVLQAMEAYRDLVLRLTDQWSGEEKSVEVTSKDVFPSGAYLLGIRKGQTNEDWKMPLLKERKRVSIVF